MNQLWPRLDPAVCLLEYEELLANKGAVDRKAVTHPQQWFAATGGVRVTPHTIGELVKSIEEVATSQGYPDKASQKMRGDFDKAAAEMIYAGMRITSFEASQPGVWSFLSLVAMPHITHWRFGLKNRERWIASDLTRHMFARLWWQVSIFGDGADDRSVDLRLLNKLKESVLNSLTERTSIGGNHRLARIMASEWTKTAQDRDVLRDLAVRVRARISFIDFAALSDGEMRHIVRELLDECDG